MQRAGIEPDSPASSIHEWLKNFISARTLMPRGGRLGKGPVRLGDQLCGASGWSAEVDADVEVEVFGEEALEFAAFGDP